MWQLGRILRMYQGKLMIDSTSHNVLRSEFVNDDQHKTRHSIISKCLVTNHSVIVRIPYRNEPPNTDVSVLINAVLYSGKEIASFGQTSAHVPHSVQVSGLIE